MLLYKEFVLQLLNTVHLCCFTIPPRQWVTFFITVLFTANLHVLPESNFFESRSVLFYMQERFFFPQLRQEKWIPLFCCIFQKLNFFFI